MRNYRTSDINATSKHGYETTKNLKKILKITPHQLNIVLNKFVDEELIYLKNKLKESDIANGNRDYIINAIADKIKEVEHLFNSTVTSPHSQAYAESLGYKLIPLSGLSQNKIQELQEQTIRNEAARRAKTPASTVSGGSKRNHKRKSRKTKKSIKRKKSKKSKRIRRH